MFRVQSTLHGCANQDAFMLLHASQLIVIYVLLYNSWPDLLLGRVVYMQMRLETGSGSSSALSGARVSSVPMHA